MPVVGKKELAAIALYRRCREWNALPRAGGILDQEESTMQLLDVIAEEVARWQRIREEERMRELAKGGFNG